MANPLYDRLFKRHENQGTIFIETVDGMQLTHGAFLRQAARFANQINQLGLEPGDRLAVQIPKSPEALAIYAACVQAGIIFLPLNTAYTAGEVAYFVENSGSKLLLCDPIQEDLLRPIAKDCSAGLETMDADGCGSFADQARTQPDTFTPVDRCEDDLAALLYTSGTTGRSKGAMLTQRNLLSNCEALTTAWQFTAADSLLHALPIFHTHGLFVATNIMLLAGGKLLFMPKFELDDIISLMPKATSLMGVPTFYTRLLEDHRFTKKAAGHMRLFISGSAPLLEETHAKFEARTGHRILERYGMTETNMSTSNPYDGERRAGTVGHPLPGVEIKITHPETGKILPNGEIGIIEVRGDNVFKGYWQMPEKTAEELQEDGYFITGDLGRFDEDGYLQIVGRNKDLIISGGLNIYPKELELLFDDQPGVLESAVIGVPHPDFGETPVAVLVPEKNVTLDLATIENAVKAKLARFKHPQKIEVLSELPRNTMGKVQKNTLREEYQHLFA